LTLKNISTAVILSSLLLGCGNSENSSQDVSSESDSQDITSSNVDNISSEKYLAKNIVFRQNSNTINQSIARETSSNNISRSIYKADAVNSETKIYADNVIFSDTNELSSLTSTNVQDALEEVTIDLKKYLPGTRWNIVNYGSSIESDPNIDYAFHTTGIVIFENDGGMTLEEGSFAAAGLSSIKNTCIEINEECEMSENDEEICRNHGAYCGPGEDITVNIFGTSTFLISYREYTPETETIASAIQTGIFWPIFIDKSKIVFIGSDGHGGVGKTKISVLTLIED